MFCITLLDLHMVGPHLYVSIINPPASRIWAGRTQAVGSPDVGQLWRVDWIWPIYMLNRCCCCLIQLKFQAAHTMARENFSPYPRESNCSPRGATWIYATSLVPQTWDSRDCPGNGVRILGGRFHLPLLTHPQSCPPLTLSLPKKISIPPSSHLPHASPDPWLTQTYPAGDGSSVGSPAQLLAP